MSDRMEVFLYPNTSSDDSLASSARDAIEEALDQTKGHFQYEGEEIDYSTTVDFIHPNLKEESILNIDLRKTMLTRFKKWQTSHDRTQTGSHVLISNSLDGGLTAGFLGGAWRNAPPTVVGSSTDNDYLKNTAVHEVFHAFLNIGLAIFNGNEYSEHILGEVLYPDTHPERTPMLDGYFKDGLATKGECNTTGNDPGYTTTLSQCTLDKTLYSYRNQGKALKGDIIPD